MAFSDVDPDLIILEGGMEPVRCLVLLCHRPSVVKSKARHPGMAVSSFVLCAPLLTFVCAAAGDGGRTR